MTLSENLSHKKGTVATRTYRESKKKMHAELLEWIKKNAAHLPGKSITDFYTIIL